jgi:putative spermidine/putrescine transport system substrate-binding protein
LFVPYKVITWDSIPGNSKDADGFWYGDYYGVISFLVNTDIQPIVPQGWTDLLNPAYKGQVALSGNPRVSNQAINSVYAAALANGGSPDNARPGLDFFAQLNRAGNLLPVFANSARVASGETPIQITWDYLALPARDSFVDHPHTMVVYPVNGRIASWYVQAISAFAPHPNAARLWMEFLYSDEGQLIWTKGYCHPIRENDLRARNVIPGELLLRFPELTGLTFPNPEQLAAAKELITKNWDSVVGLNIQP